MKCRKAQTGAQGVLRDSAGESEREQRRLRVGMWIGLQGVTWARDT
jgi:hypothetical protein